MIEEAAGECVAETRFIGAGMVKALRCPAPLGTRLHSRAAGKQEIGEGGFVGRTGQAARGADDGDLIFTDRNHRVLGRKIRM